MASFTVDISMSRNTKKPLLSIKNEKGIKKFPWIFFLKFWLAFSALCECQLSTSGIKLTSAYENKSRKWKFSMEFVCKILGHNFSMTQQNKKSFFFKCAFKELRGYTQYLYGQTWQLVHDSAIKKLNLEHSK